MAYRRPFEKVRRSRRLISTLTLMQGHAGQLGRGEDHLGPSIREGRNGCQCYSIALASSLTSQVDPTETSLLVTEPYFNLPNIAETYDQMVFEEWEFDSYFRCTREYNPPAGTDSPLLTLMVSCGFDTLRRALWRYFPSPTMPPRCGHRLFILSHHTDQRRRNTMDPRQAVSSLVWSAYIAESAG